MKDDQQKVFVCMFTHTQTNIETKEEMDYIKTALGFFPDFDCGVKYAKKYHETTMEEYAGETCESNYETITITEKKGKPSYLKVIKTYDDKAGNHFEDVIDVYEIGNITDKNPCEENNSLFY